MCEYTWLKHLPGTTLLGLQKWKYDKNTCKTMVLWLKEDLINSQFVLVCFGYEKNQNYNSFLELYFHNNVFDYCH